jgi:hypothetical protein
LVRRAIRRARFAGALGMSISEVRDETMRARVTRRVYIAAVVLMGLGLLRTFPPVWGLLRG